MKKKAVMDKKSFEMVLDEIRKAVMTDYKVKALEYVHGYFSCDQVVELLRYFSWAEPQLKAVKAMQHKMVAIPAAKMVNILNCFTFSKDRLSALELLAMNMTRGSFLTGVGGNPSRNILDASNCRPIEDIFKISHAEKKRCRKILDQATKSGCKAPNAMISSCGMIPGNPYPKGKPSHINGIFPGAPKKKDGEEPTNEGKGIAARILGPCKPPPSSYNPHKPVPYPIPPCRPHATIAPNCYGKTLAAKKEQSMLKTSGEGLSERGGASVHSMNSRDWAKTDGNYSAYSNGSLITVANVTPGTVPPSPYTPNPPAVATGIEENSAQAKAAHDQSANQHISPQEANPAASPSLQATPATAASPAKTINSPSTPTTLPFSGICMPTPLPAFPPQTTASVFSPKPSTPSPSVIKSTPGSSSSPRAASTEPSAPSPAFSSLPHASVSAQQGSSTPSSSSVMNDNLPSLHLAGLPFSATTSTASVSIANMMPSLFAGLPLPLNPPLQSISTLADIASASAGSLNIGNPLLSVLKGFLAANDPTSLNSTSMPSVSTPGLLPLQSLQNSEPSLNKGFTPQCSTPTPQRTATPVLGMFTTSASLSIPNPIPTSSSVLAQPLIPAPSHLSAPLVPPCQAPSSSLSDHRLSSSPAASGASLLIKSEPISPSPSAFKGPSRSGTPSNASLGLPGVLGHVFPPGAGSLPNTINPGLPGMPSMNGNFNNPSLSSISLNPHVSSTPMPPVFSALPPFTSLSNGSPFAGGPVINPTIGMLSSACNADSATPPLTSAVFPGLSASAASSFPLSLSAAVPSLFSVTQGPLGSSNPSFPAFPVSSTPPINSALPPFPGLQAPSTLVSVPPVPSVATAPSPASVLPGFASAFSSNFNSALVAQAGPSPSFQGLQPSAAVAAAAAQSALLQAHSASALENFVPQADVFAAFPAGPGTPFPLQPGLPQRGWQ
ncbi:proline and serine-rich protein 1 isoform X3 [Xenopus laevis]|uniref:Proline and serine-rich protein 1 isoform X3 n=1 Tax=Xenopus laevis TaxID=8355 RepID=A0A8J0UM12_XENLA|nr:proline and serine-rich protein 1 isoform X3 [Xenopus laevis]